MAATHGVLAPGGTERLAGLGARLLLTDTIRPPDPADGARGLLEVCTVAPLLAKAIRRLHEEAPLDDLAPGA